MRRTMTALGLGLSATLLAGGCGLVGGDNAKSTQRPDSSKAQAAATASPQAAKGPAVSKQMSLPVPGRQGASVTIGFAGLKVKGQLATLTLVWTPHMTGSDKYDLNGKYDINNMRGNPTLGDGGTMAMIDTVNLKRYTVVQDSDNHELGPDPNTAATGNNQPLTTQYTFAAPPGNASMDVYMDDGKIFDAVPVTR